MLTITTYEFNWAKRENVRKRRKITNFHWKKDFLDKNHILKLIIENT